MFTQPITIYNRYLDDGVEKFKRTVIEKAHWEATESVNLGAISIRSSNAISVVVPFKTVGYKPSREYVGVGWTLQANDYVVKGVLDKEISSYADLKDVDFKMTITTFEINDYAKTSRLSNYTIEGR